MSAAATVDAPGRPTGWPARSESRVALTGTIGGLAQWLGAPVDFLRVLVAVAVYAQPWTFVAYVVAAVALAAPGERRPGLGNLVVAAKVAAVVGLLYGPTLLPGTDGVLDGEPSSWIPYGAIVLVGLTALLVRRRPESATRAPLDAVVATVPFALAAAVFVLGVALFPSVRCDRFLFLPALIAGVVVLWRPRATLVRAAITPAAVLAGISALAIGAGVRLEGGVGDTTARPRTTAELPRQVRRAVGDVELDLTRLGGASTPLTVDASVGVGTLEVMTPRRALVELEARIGQGRHSLEGATEGDVGRGNFRIQDGRGDVFRRGIPVAGPGRRVRPRLRLRLRLRGGAGQITVSDPSHTTRWTP